MTLDCELAALERSDVGNGHKDFERFHIEWAMVFRTDLGQAKDRTGKFLSKSTSRAIMATVREFTIWLSQQEGYRSRIRTSDADYFNLSRRDEAEARASSRRPTPSVQQGQHAFDLMPSTTPREMRDKAVFALLCLTGIRVGALISLCIRHVDLDEKSVTQNPREVATKFGKRIDTFFAKGLPEAKAVLRNWIAYLEDEALYGPDDPLFPATAIAPNSNTGFTVEGFERRPWKSTEPVRKIVNAAFQAAKLDSFGPHAFRHMLARHAAQNCTAVAEIVATARNLGHSDVRTTLRSYGQISRERQRALITGESGDDLMED
ncbi:Site-specific recombinase XerD [Roseivivax lentus]|uniref:Site-specific recombinase XerD n=1 Tax=Roseivivax lentus TaxID=633194 RepID=A0A1N7PBQ1_9RHOB|nr:site-specific integrase [Roseivivax lentus]SIT08073.1 Site-specific recombinase XerD [Roseivivax lentus]